MFPWLYKPKNSPKSLFLLFVLFDWALDPSPVMGRPLLWGSASSLRVWHVCNTRSSSEGTLSTPRGHEEGPGQIPNQVREGAYG